MKLKRFVAADTTKAMRKIKEAFGDDAVILSSHTVKEGVEVVAAVDYDESVIKKQLATDTSTTPLLESNVTAKQSTSGISELDDIKSEVMHLRELIENQLSGFAWQNMAHFEPIQMMLIKRLNQLGFEITLSEKLVKTIDKKEGQQKAWLSLLSNILQHLQFQNDLLDTGGYYAFVGSTGVGKTTTIAKLAARFCLQHGADELGLVTMDGYRIAAVEQLVTFAKILGVNVSVAQNQQTLKTTLNKLSHKKLILIDTAGMNPQDDRVKQQFDMLSYANVPINPILVFSATSQYDVLKKTYQSYQPYHIESSIMTKLDEAQAIGASLSLLINHRLSLAYLTDGQRVPEDLQFASNQIILQNLINKHEVLAQDINLNQLVPSLSGSDVYV